MKFKNWMQERGQILFSNIFSRIFWPPPTAVSIVKRENQILAIDAGNFLMLPAGTLKYNESFEEAALRELKEESGLEGEIKERICENTNPAGGPEVIFEVEAEGSISNGNWEGRPKWIDLKRVDEKEWRFNRDISSLIEE